MSNHTPGPWRLEKRGGTYIVDKPGDGYITRDVCRMDASTMSAFHQDGNARLITAAPDLLEALQKLINDQRDASLPVLAQARNAIKKATEGNQ